MSLFTGVVKYIAQFDPKFKPTAASTQQIRTLESMAGRPLPAAYRSFLEVMGTGMDWLVIDHFDLNIDTVIDFYRTGSWLSQTQYFRIGSATMPPMAHPHLELVPYSDDPQEVICIPDYGPNSFRDELRRRMPYAGSLEEMICMPVFDMYELNGEDRTPVHLASDDKVPGGLEKAEAILTRAGLQPVWFSSPTGRAYWRQDGAAKAVQTYLGPLHVSVSFESDASARPVIEELVAELGVKPASSRAAT